MAASVCVASGLEESLGGTKKRGLTLRLFGSKRGGPAPRSHRRLLGQEPIKVDPGKLLQSDQAGSPTAVVPLRVVVMHASVDVEGALRRMSEITNELACVTGDLNAEFDPIRVLNEGPECGREAVHAGDVDEEDRLLVRDLRESRLALRAVTGERVPFEVEPERAEGEERG